MNLIKLLALAILIMASGCKKDEEIRITEKMVDVGGHDLYTIVKGSGNKTVVFESGLGDDSGAWLARRTFQNTADFARAIAYNRAGYEPSELGTGRRSVEQMISELDEVISKQADNKKVVLVGHSLGGMIIRAYAINHPEKVAGLVFVDPSHEDCNALTPEEQDMIVQYYQATNGENSIVSKEAAQLVENVVYKKTLPILPNVPTVVLTSMQTGPEDDAAGRQKWYNAHETLGEGLSDFEHIGTVNSSHYIMLDEPKLVLNAIMDIVQK